MADRTQKAKQIKQEFEKKWLSIEGVAAIGIGLLEDGETGIIISVYTNPDKIRNRVPQSVQNIRIEVRETGTFKAQ